MKNSYRNIEFLRAVINNLVGKIIRHPIFQSTSARRPQRPVAHQLMVFLHYIGTSGSGASNPRLRQMFGIGRGTAEDFKKRCITAIRSLGLEAICWPNEDERKDIAKRIFNEYDWINCIGVADGTLIPLTYAPQSKDSPDYHGRKHPYSLSIMIINDDTKKIRMYRSGNPGSVHDSRIYSCSTTWSKLLRFP